MARGVGLLHLEVERFTITPYGARYWLRIEIYAYSICCSPLEYCQNNVWHGSRMAWLTDGEKKLTICLFVSTALHERGGRTDTTRRHRQDYQNTMPCGLTKLLQNIKGAIFGLLILYTCPSRKYKAVCYQFNPSSRECSENSCKTN